MLTNYLKIAMKVLLRRKFYTFVSLFGIAFTLLVMNLCVAMLDHSLAPNPPETRLHRILGIERARMAGPSSTSTSNPGYALLDAYARGLPRVEKFSIASNPDVVSSFVDGKKIKSKLRRTDGNFWGIMDFEFVEGSPFTEADERAGNSVAVINETTRERFFKGESAVGKTLRADGQAFTVIGVVRDVPLIRAMCFSEIWVPISTSKSTTYRDEMLGNFVGIVLAEDPDAFAGIKEEFRSRLASAQLPDPSRYDTLESGAFTRYEEMAMDMLGRTGEQPPTGKMTLMIVVFGLLFLTLPVLNLVNLNLSRILERASEIGVRKAFGASSWTLVGQFLVESVVLTLIGGVVGLGLSVVVLRVVSGIDAIPYAVLSVNFRIFLYGLGLAVLFGVLSGAYPAWRMSRLHPVEALHGRAQ